MFEKKAHRPRILVVYQYIALYRLPVFTELSHSQVFDFEFMSGVSGIGETPKLATHDELRNAPFRWRETRNIWLPKGMLWQSDVISASLSSRYDAVIFLGDMHYISTWVATLLMRALGKSFFFWTIGMHRPDRGMKLLVRNLWHRLPKHILLYGDYARNLMIKGGLDSTRMSVIGNSLDFATHGALLKEVAATPPTKLAEPLIIAIGRLTARRKLDRLVEAVALLNNRGKRVRVRLIGGGPHLERLAALVEKLGVGDQVEILGPIYDEAIIARQMYQADLCVVPGIIGLGAVHSHSYGTPVITCGDWSIQAPEAEVIQPGLTGAFCAWDDSVSTAREIERWLMAGVDRDEVRRMCLAAVAQKWTPQRQREIVETALAPYFENLLVGASSHGAAMHEKSCSHTRSDV